jgi:purine-cytosine permease-like protein
MVVSSFAIGLLAQKLFFLGFTDACLACLFFNLIGIIPVCYFSTFGPRFGLRQMVLSRFWFGWYGVKISKFNQHLVFHTSNILFQLLCSIS